MENEGLSIKQIKCQLTFTRFPAFFFLFSFFIFLFTFICSLVKRMVLLPVWLGVYRYESKEFYVCSYFLFLKNKQTNKNYSSPSPSLTPSSPPKIMSKFQWSMDKQEKCVVIVPMELAKQEKCLIVFLLLELRHWKIWVKKPGYYNCYYCCCFRSCLTFFFFFIKRSSKGSNRLTRKRKEKARKKEIQCGREIQCKRTTEWR